MWVFWLAVALPAWAAQPVHARHAMVVTVEQHATDAGVAVLQSGGNAVDAAVAVGFALAVTHPSAGNIGGGGFMLVRFADGRSTFIDFRERAPERASRDMYLDASGKPTEDSVSWISRSRGARIGARLRVRIEEIRAEGVGGCGSARSSLGPNRIPGFLRVREIA